MSNSRLIYSVIFFSLGYSNINHCEDYSGLIEPWEHYLPIKPDASDFDAVLEAMRDVDEIEKKEEDFAAVMGATADLRTPVDAFFDQVTVNCKDRALRQNRLCLLGQIRDSLKSVADFSLIKG